MMKKQMKKYMNKQNNIKQKDKKKREKGEDFFYSQKNDLFSKMAQKKMNHLSLIIK